MKYLELIRANPATKAPTLATFPEDRLNATHEQLQVNFVCINGNLTANMVVKVNSWRKETCYQHYRWLPKTMEWKESHITFGDNWLG